MAIVGYVRRAECVHAAACPHHQLLCLHAHQACCFALPSWVAGPLSHQHMLAVTAALCPARLPSIICARDMAQAEGPTTVLSHPSNVSVARSDAQSGICCLQALVCHSMIPPHEVALWARPEAAQRQALHCSTLRVLNDHSPGRIKGWQHAAATLYCELGTSTNL